MELRQLRGFMRVVELGSMGRAGGELGLVTSALSQQINRLEGELPVRLLQRSSRGVQPTDAGPAFLQQAQLVLRHAEAAVQATQSQRLSGAVSVGLTPTTAAVLGLRKGAHGAGSWALPGGHLEFGYTVETCARREVLEETGLTLSTSSPLQTGPCVNGVFIDEGRHHVTQFVLAGSSLGEPQLMETVKCERWAWFAWDELPRPLFQPLQTLRDTGYVPA